MLCDRVGLIRGGRLAAVGRIGELLSARVRTVEATFRLGSAVLPAGGREVAREGDQVTVSFDDEATADRAVRETLAAGARLVSLTPHRETLEDFFVRRLEGERAPGEEPVRMRRVGAP